MMSESERRRRTLVELIRSRPLTRQEDLVVALADQGFRATQATVSRDLDRLGAVKTRQGGLSGYALPGAPQSPEQRRLAEILATWALSVEAAGTLVVIRTPPGSAHLVGVALDQAQRSDVAGTICGDDTLFLACRSIEDALACAADLQACHQGMPGS